jgi:hypothetical protein
MFIRLDLFRARQAPNLARRIKLLIINFHFPKLLKPEGERSRPSAAAPPSGGLD